MRFRWSDRRLAIWVVIIALLSLTAAAKPKPIRILKVEIQATVIDRETLLTKLNKNGKRYHMRFVEVSGKKYDYRIVFSTEEDQHSIVLGRCSLWGITAHSSSTDVFGPTGAELFRYQNEHKCTSRAAAKGAAKEIIKQIGRLDTFSENKK